MKDKTGMELIHTEKGLRCHKKTDHEGNSREKKEGEKEYMKRGGRRETDR